MTPRVLIRAGLAALLFAPFAFSQTTSVSGAGGTFIYPLASKWFHEYNVINPKIQINYQSIGSGGGIRQFSVDKTVDFGETDGPMTDQQLAKAKISPSTTCPWPWAGWCRSTISPRAALKLPAMPSPISTWARWPCGTTRPSPRTTRASSFPPRPSTWSTAPTAPARPTSWWTTFPRCALVQEQGRAGHLRELASGPGRQGQRRRHRSGHARPPAPSATWS